jgi:CheY-like chemotaxis protein
MAEHSDAVGLLLSDDLMFTSRIVGVARDLGLTVRSARSTDALLNLARQHALCCVILDLANAGLVLTELMRELRALPGVLPRVVAYGSHVDAESLRAARAAGCDPVFPRSKFVEELPNALPHWFEPVEPDGAP